jgi:glutamate racemase
MLPTVHLVITDSGLGGLAACGSLESALRTSGRTGVRITYVNAWPEQGHGYNDLPDAAARARVFDRALEAIAGMQPDLILIACNTLSILYELTAFRRRATIPVQGIIGAGVELFSEALAAEPESSIVLLGTRTTIESGVHRRRLLDRGVAAERIAAQSCHGLATAIEHGPASAATEAMIDACAEAAARVVTGGDPLFAGLCCTHYGMAAERIGAALARTTGRLVGPLDPADTLVRAVLPRLGREAARAGAGPAAVRVISKVALDDGQRDGVASVLQLVSPVTAAALRTYQNIPDLF